MVADRSCGWLLADLSDGCCFMLSGGVDSWMQIHAPKSYRPDIICTYGDGFVFVHSLCATRGLFYLIKPMVWFTGLTTLKKNYGTHVI